MTRLVLLSLLLALALGGLGADLLVVLLEGGQVLTGLGELALLHALADVPVDEGALGVHQVELVVDARVELGDGGGVGHHRDGAHHLGQVTAGDDGGRLVVDAALEAGGAPVDELDGALRLDGRDGGVHVLGHDVAAVHEAHGHVLAVARVDLHEHRRGLERRLSDLGNGELLVVRLLRRDDGRVRRHDEVDAWVWHQVGLEVGDVDVERAIKAEPGGALVYVGRSMSRLRRQMSYTASLSTMNETSAWSSSECVESTQLYGSTTAVETCGDG
mmetsp:Transcript_12949/g.27497  ORF Transcript_12949/g.27497 Transcript_12949/m.27497 type:complete len:273 (-) Transcript_12949:506-1324(-)